MLEEQFCCVECDAVGTKIKLKNLFAALNKSMDHLDAITLKQLRALAAIVRAGTLTAAADALNVTPPAVSTQLRTLEANVGGEVLSRGPDGKVALTPAGQEVLAAAHAIEARLAVSRARLKALAEGRSGHVSLGVVSTAKYFVPGLVALARDSMPDVSIALRVGNREETIASLLSGETDLAVMGRPPVAPDVVSEPIGPNPHVLVVPPAHRLLARPVTADRLGAETFLLREQGSGTRILTERFLDESLGGRPYDSVELGTNETIKQGVMAGLGVAILSGNTVLGEVTTGRLAVARAPGLPIVRQWFVVHLAGRPVATAATTLARFIVENRTRVLPDVVEALG